MPLVTGNITVHRASESSITATISEWYSSHASPSPSPTRYIILVDNDPPSTSIPAPIAAPTSRVPFVNELSLPPAAFHITSSPALAQTHAASTVRASSGLCGNAIETASSRTTSWNGTGRPGPLKTPGTVTHTSATFAAAGSLLRAT